MQQLAGLDASFLHLETAQMPMHVGALHVLELPADFTGDYVERLRAHLAERLPAVPALRRRLAPMPLGLSNPAWVEEEPDLTAHIVEIALPEGSGLAALEAAVGRLHAVLLDRRRPLWKFHVFTGLAPGPEGLPRVALYTQLHHAAVDGQAAVALAQVILDTAPAPRALALPAPRTTRPGPLGTASLLRAALQQQWTLSLKLATALPGAATALGGLAAQALGSASAAPLRARLGQVATQAAAVLRGQQALSGLGPAPRTRFNVSLSAERAFSTASLSLSDLHRARKRHGASVNDALLFIIGGALRRFLSKHGPLPRKSLVAAVPVSTRDAGDTRANTQATLALMSLGTHLADPAARLAHVQAASQGMKTQKSALKRLMPTDFPALGIPWLMQAGALLYGKARVAERLPVLANVVISNVPGPTVPLYLAGARLLTNYPTSIAVHGLALNVTVQTYDQSLDIGLMACARACPQTAELAAHVEAAFLELQALPGPAPAKKVTKATARPRTNTSRSRPARG